MLPTLMSALRASELTPAPSRRGFLLGAMALGTGLAVGFRPWGDAAAAATPAGAGVLTPYITIDADSRVTILSAHMDMGQGCYHGIATLVVEELGCDWAQVRVEGGAGNVKVFGNLAWGGFAQGTGGSTAMASSWTRYREAGAAARQMLVAAAAQAWGVAAREITVAKGEVRHASGRTATYGAMAAAAAALSAPDKPELKPASAWTEIGNPALKRFDRAAKTTGTQAFTIDVKLPGLLTAVMIHPPKFGATLKSFDASKAAGIKGFVEAVATPRGVAVLGDTMWSALQAREAVTATWDESQAEQRGSAEILAQYRALATQPPKATARKDGEGAAAMAKAARVIDATFEFPYLAHAALEPLNAVVRRAEDGTIEVWGGHQMPDIYQAVAAGVAGTTPDKVRLHVMKTGGGFGRRAVADADIIVEAVAAARAINWRAPVKVQWTRENDMAGGRYRPAYVHRLRAGLDASGAVIAWENHIVGQSIMANSPFAGMITNGVDPTSVEGSSSLPYTIPNLEVGLTTTDVKVPVLWWRAVGSTHTAYATEVFLDEIARAGGKDPVALRLSLLGKHPRHAAALRLVAEKAGWGTPPPAGRHRGVAVHESFGSVVAEIAEVSVAGAAITVHKVWCAVDCGVAINPDTIRAQMEGGIGFGLGAILQEELTLTAGRVDQSNYDTYRPLRIDQMPQVEVHIVPSTNAPTGVGEPGTPPIGAAVANAIFAATGKAVRTLPISKGLTS